MYPAISPLSEKECENNFIPNYAIHFSWGSIVLILLSSDVHYKSNRYLIV